MEERRLEASMLEGILKNALEGFTVIEESSGSVARLLARQLGGYARASGRRVAFVSLSSWEPGFGKEAQRISVDPGGSETSGSGLGSQAGYSRGSGVPFLDAGNYDVLVVDALSTFLADRTTKEAAEMVRQIARMARQGRSFIVTFDAALLDDKTAAFIRASADSVIVVKSELIGEKVNRTLYVPKLRDSRPLDKLIKITVDETSVQVDTREFVG